MVGESDPRQRPGTVAEAVAGAGLGRVAAEGKAGGLALGVGLDTTARAAGGAVFGAVGHVLDVQRIAAFRTLAFLVGVADRLACNPHFYFLVCWSGEFPSMPLLYRLLIELARVNRKRFWK